MVKQGAEITASPDEFLTNSTENKCVLWILEHLEFVSSHAYSEYIAQDKLGMHISPRLYQECCNDNLQNNCIYRTDQSAVSLLSVTQF